MIENTDVYPPNEIDKVIGIAFADVKTVKKQERREDKRNSIEYFNCPCAFDIEASSFYEGEEKRAIMYGWTMDLNGLVILGRKWSEFVECIERLSDALSLDNNRRLTIYIHNFSGYEFQWIRKWFKWEKVFAISKRKPVYALCDLGVEFRCSYILTDYSLETVGTLLKKYPVKKLVGDLDYSRLRHSETPLTEKEMGYMVNDVKVVTHYIQEQIEKEGNITRIPLTKTGYVRRYCRNACIRGKYKFYNYHNLMKQLVLVPDEYKMLKRAFAGGFTHANGWKADKELTNLASYDFCSSYPAVIVAEDKFPMSRGQKVKITSEKQFREHLFYYWCLFDVELIGVCAKEDVFEHIISSSKCWNLENAQVDNGRIVQCDRLRITITGEDFEIIEKFYDIEEYRIGDFWRYRRGYLPTDFVQSVLELYRQKTELKNVKGSEEFYQNAKEKLNACFGMCVTDICRDENNYIDDEWENKAEWYIAQREKFKDEIEEIHSEHPDRHWMDIVDDLYLQAKLHKENNSFNRFLFYPWGVAITSFARRNLFIGILACGEDYVYSDTDSIKVLNPEKHKDYFEQYNENVIKKMKCAMDYHELSYDYITPKTIEGKVKPLGVWECEGILDKFKTLGAKRYAIEKDGKISFTVSGVNKKTAIPYLLKKYGKERFFDNFEFGLEIPSGFTGKMTHTYIDDETSGEVIDYLGNKGRYYERSSLHLEPCEYILDDTIPYVEYLLGIEERNK